MQASWSATFPGASSVRALRGFPGATGRRASCFLCPAHAAGPRRVASLPGEEPRPRRSADHHEEHQAHESQIAISTETLPELRDFFRRERHDDPPILFEAEALGDGGAGPAVAERGPLGTVYRRYVPRLGHNQAIGAIAHRQCRLIWLILHQGVRYDERGPAVTKQSKQKRTARVIRQLRRLGYRIEPPKPQPSQAQ
jgi:hypothetical protein